MANAILHKKRGSDSNAPQAGDLQYGEIAINYHVGDEAVYIKNSADEIVSIGGGGGVEYLVKTSEHLASSGEYLLCDCSTGWTLTLPANPSSTDFVNILVVDADVSNYLTVAVNGKTIEGDSEDMIVDESGVKLTLVYDGSTWRVGD